MATARPTDPGVVGASPPRTRRGPAPQPTGSGPTVENTATAKQHRLTADGATPLDMPPRRARDTLDQVMRDAADRKRRRLASQLERAEQQRRLVGDHAAADLARAWAAEARGAA